MTGRGRLLAALAALGVVAGGGVLVSRRSAPRASAPPITAAAQQRITARRAHLEQLAASPQPALALRQAWDGEKDRAARIEILQMAAHVADPAGLQFLIEVAASQDPLASQAGASIGRIASPRVTHELARVATSDAPVLVRANAARALARSNGTLEVDTLTSLVADPSAPLRVRQEAALALGSIGDNSATAALAATLDALAPDPGEPALQLRISIVQALGGIRSADATAALRRHHERALGATELAFVNRALGAAA